MLSGSAKELAIQLFTAGAVQFGSFRLKLHETQPEAPLSPIFLNLRTADNPKPGPLTEHMLLDMGKLLLEQLTKNNVAFDHIAGIPNAGDPFAKALEQVLCERGRSMSVLSFTKEEEGGKRRIGTLNPGDYKPGDRVLLIDDLITKADSKFEAMDQVEAAGLQVAGVLVLVNRQQGGKEQLLERRCELFSAFTITELLDVYVDQGFIDESKRREVLEYLRSN